MLDAGDEARHARAVEPVAGRQGQQGAAQGGRREDWIGTLAFLAMSCAIWVVGRAILFVSRDK